MLNTKEPEHHRVMRHVSILGNNDYACHEQHYPKGVAKVYLSNKKTIAKEADNVAFDDHKRLATAQEVLLTKEHISHNKILFVSYEDAPEKGYWLINNISYGGAVSLKPITGHEAKKLQSKDWSTYYDKILFVDSSVAKSVSKKETLILKMAELKSRGLVNSISCAILSGRTIHNYSIEGYPAECDRDSGYEGIGTYIHTLKK